MQAKTYSWIDKSSWAPGPWHNEPDKAQWVDEATGLPCLIRRVDDSGHLCGYVGVGPEHPLFGKSYAEDCAILTGDSPLPEGAFRVHGGLTFSEFCSPEENEHGICHVVEPGENDRVWWFGFDAHHCDDMAPGSKYCRDGKYRTFDYMKEQCGELARQLAEVTTNGGTDGASNGA